MNLKQKIDFSKGSEARAQINSEFYTSKWNDFRKWYFQSYTKKEFDIIIKKFYESCELQNKMLRFVPWFIKTYVKNYISVIERDYKLSSGQIQKSVYPPQKPFQIEKEDKIIKFNAFSKLFEGNVPQITIEHINELLKKQNFTNLYISIIAEEIKSIKNNIEKIIKPEKIIPEKKEENIILVSSSIQPPL